MERRQRPRSCRRREKDGRGEPYPSGCNSIPAPKGKRFDDTPDPPPGLGAAVTDLERALADPRRYRRQIERLFDRTLFSPVRRSLRQAGVPFESVFDRQRRFARLLARTVAAGDYEFAPGRVREIRVGGKVREVFAFRMTDRLVHGVAAEIIDEAAQPRLSASLYSYRKGLSWWHAVRLLGAYMRAQRKARPDPKDRGLFVIRRDIDSYTDSIPVGPGSPLWPMLHRLLEGKDGRLPEAAWTVIERVVRPEARAKDGGLMCLTRGLPTGQPISCVVFNFYLHELDRRLDAVPGAFYARFSDDILFAHPEPGPVQEAARIIEETAAALDLKLKLEKSRDLYVTAPGRPAPPGCPARGRSSIPFLGVEVWTDGTVSLGREKARAFVRDLEDRASRTARALCGSAPDAIGRGICSVLNRALRPETAPFRQRSADTLWRIVTNRPQLLHLDGLVARIVLRAATGRTGPRAFRTIPLRKIRSEWGLLSLYHGRNKRPRRPS